VQVILKETLDNLGPAGAIVNVKDGYARNFLFARDLAAPATSGMHRQLEHIKLLAEKKRLSEVKTAEDLRDRFQSTEITIEARAGEQNKLFGSVTPANIVEALASQGIEISRRKVSIERPIRELGEHVVTIKVDPEVSAELKVIVIPSADSVLREPEEERAPKSKDPQEQASAEGDAEEPVGDEDAPPEVEEPSASGNTEDEETEEI